MGGTDPRRFLENLRKVSHLKTEYWATVDEAMILFHQVQSSGAQGYVESGTCHGFTACWAATTNVREVHTFDPVEREKIWTREGLAVLTPKIHFHLGKFEDLVEEALYEFHLQERLYFFIDGDHTSKGVSADFNIIEPYLANEDRVMFHDAITEHAVAKFVEMVAKRFPDWVRKDFKTDRGMTEFEVRGR